MNNVHNSFYEFHNKILDYAGLFPPAKLDLETAIRNYVYYKKQSDSWMLGKFIIPHNQLIELINNEFLPRDNSKSEFSVLGGTFSNLIDFQKDLEVLFRNIKTFENKLNDLVLVKTLELKIPSVKDYGLILNFIQSTLTSIENDSIDEIFLEIENEDDLNILLKELSVFNSKNISSNLPYIGFKIRTGGVVSTAFPTTKLIENVIISCSKYNIKFKATAGLHHPLRHYNDSVLTKMHGFLNVIGGSILFTSGKIDENVLSELLNDEDPNNFIFTKNSFSWKNFTVSYEEIKEKRSNNFISFGSCSFDEPREDLKKLKLLP